MPTSKTKEYLQYAAVALGLSIAIVTIVVTVSMGMRTLSSATTKETFSTPRPGIECVRWITADGVAGECWRTDGLPAIK